MGPLEGLKVVEVASVGPVPFCAMLLADMGADVVRIDRPRETVPGPDELQGDAERRARATEDEPPAPLDFVLRRGRRSIAVDLKNPEGVCLVLDLCEEADVLLEGFRPGVAERLGIGPEDCLGRNPGLVYGRGTGWGQEGPLAQAAGHDINYIALAGTLEPIGRPGQPPTVPLTLIGDFGGGGMVLTVGVTCALLERQRSGRGQVVDAAMVDGAALLMTLQYGARALGVWSDERGTNITGGSHFYDVYETADGKYISLAAADPPFYAELLRRLDLDRERLPDQMDRERWPEMKTRFAEIFRQRTRAEWCELLQDTDVCFAPVLSMAEAPEHLHNRARRTFVDIDGVVQPAPAPRFSRTESVIQRPPPRPGEHADEALRDWGVSDQQIAKLRRARAIL